jgi:hypothetical protein
LAEDGAGDFGFGESDGAVDCGFGLGGDFESVDFEVGVLGDVDCQAVAAGREVEEFEGTGADEVEADGGAAGAGGEGGFAVVIQACGEDVAAGFCL